MGLWTNKHKPKGVGPIWAYGPIRLNPAGLYLGPWANGLGMYLHDRIYIVDVPRLSENPSMQSNVVLNMTWNPT